MNILFLTLIKIDNLQERGIYHDLMREFAAHNHNLYIVSPLERREKKGFSFTSEENVHFLNIKTLNIQKTHIIEKGLATLSIEFIYLRAIKKYFNNVKFDLILYSTPPITFTKIINFIKNRDGAKSYLLLKDIFPQNAVDMKMIGENGVLHKFFRNKEINLYKMSDAIGCMSEANRDYLIKHNPTLEKEKIEVNGNSIELEDYVGISKSEINLIRKKYNLPLEKKIFLYGGNLGVPQGIDFLLETLENSKSDQRLFFLIVGSGTEYEKVDNWFKRIKPVNAALIPSLPKDDYDEIVKSCDVGMIFLHKNFTIPNFPSRILNYLEFKIPVLLAVDSVTDIGRDVEKYKCGFSVSSGDINAMKEVLNIYCTMDSNSYSKMQSNGSNYLMENFLVSQAYCKVINKLNLCFKSQ